MDKPLVEYLERPLPSYTFKETYEGYQDLDRDERYKKITARMCLSHTTGFPNWRYIGNSGIDMNKPLEIESNPRTYYSYSREGIQLLQFVVEQVTGKRLEELAQMYVFEPFHMTMTSFLWQDRFETNYAVGHYDRKKVLERQKRNKEYAAGRMETTPYDYARFIQAMLARKGLSTTAFDEMFKPQIAIVSKQQFGDNRWKTTDENKDINLSYGAYMRHFLEKRFLKKVTWMAGNIMLYSTHQKILGWSLCATVQTEKEFLKRYGKLLWQINGCHGIGKISYLITGKSKHGDFKN